MVRNFMFSLILYNISGISFSHIHNFLCFMYLCCMCTRFCMMCIKVSILCFITFFHHFYISYIILIAITCYIWLHTVFWFGIEIFYFYIQSLCANYICIQEVFRVFFWGYIGILCTYIRALNPILCVYLCMVKRAK